MDSLSFTKHIRTALQHLNDLPGLAADPAPALRAWLALAAPGKANQDAAYALQSAIREGIDRFRPPEALDLNRPRHRTYKLLWSRYIECAPLAQLSSELCISERQLRRETLRAVNELAASLWLTQPAPGELVAPVIDPPAPFVPAPSAVNLGEVLVECVKLLTPMRAQAQVGIDLDLPPDLPLARVDRTALRLGLLKLMRLGLATAECESLRISASLQAGQLAMRVSGLRAIDSNSPAFLETRKALAINDIELTIHSARGGHAELVAQLPIQQTLVILVVDDDPAMARIITRYLALSGGIQVLPCTSHEDVLALAADRQPALIVLDVLMPQRDGWDILQQLKLTPATQALSVAVCTGWDEREMALSLGADFFFQKPLDRERFLSAVTSIQLPGLTLHADE